MSDEKTPRGNIYSANDTLDINELASLNDDISPEFIEQLQNKVSQNASEFTGKPVKKEKDDTELFEEVSSDDGKAGAKAKFDESIDDNFIKKYKAKLNKQVSLVTQEDVQKEGEKNKSQESEDADAESSQNDKKNVLTENTQVDIEEVKADSSQTVVPEAQNPAEIAALTGGNITEKPIVKEQLEYNESLDLLDDNIKYSKYVIYVDPENQEFIESLTVKERKNLINRILREQDDIAITKKRLSLMQTIIKHSIIAILTVSIAIPVVYWTINASLEASINNYRRSQSIFKTLYKEKGKIKSTKQY